MSPPAAVLSDLSVMMTTFNHGPYVEETISSILGQSRPPGQLVICDDHSPDDTWEAIQRAVAGHTGPTEICLHRQPRRLGGPHNRHSAWSRVDRRYLVFAHGDDISQPERLERIHQVFTEHGATTISHNAWQYCEGEPLELKAEAGSAAGFLGLEAICAQPFNPYVLGATLAMDRVVYERFPATAPPDGAGVGPSDVILPLRGALLNGHYYIDEPLLYWRRHPGQSTARFFQLEGPESTTGDRPAAPQETLEAFFVYGQLQRLRDIIHFSRTGGDPAKVQLARSLTLQTWMRRLRNWSALHQRLEEAGCTHHWELGS